MIFTKLTLCMVLVMFLCSENKVEGLSTSVDMVDDTWASNQNDDDATRAFWQHQSQAPKYFDVRQNYPNPFNATTIIEFDLPTESGVYAVVYDVLGRRIRTLENDILSPGRYKLEWDGRTDGDGAVSSGVYFYVLQVDDNYAIRKMLLLK